MRGAPSASSPSSCVLSLARAALSVSLAFVVVAGGCDCGSETPKADAGHLPLDAGGDPGDPPDGGQPGDAGGLQDAGGEPPLTLEQQARELCFAYARGLLNLERHRALSSPPARCSNEDPAPDVDADEALPIGTCGVQDPLRDLFVRALGGGRVEIDRDAFRACVEKGRSARAAAPTLGDIGARAAAIEALALDEDCRAAITPLVSEEGATCLQAWDCVPPLACQADPLDSFSLKCLPPAVEGARCDDAPPFEDVLPLRTCADGLACVLGVCTARLAADAACTDDGVPCVEGLTCRSSGTCGAPSSESEACLDDGDCVEGLACDGSTQACVVVPPPSDDGEPCASSNDCAGLCSVCRPLEDSDGGTACQDRAPAGGACGANDHCRGGLYCDGATNTCAPYRSLDETCGLGAPCAAGLLCTDQPPPLAPDAGIVEPPEDAGDGGVVGPTCQEPRALGEGCERVGVWRCDEGLACVDGVCRAGALDDPCLVDNDCQEGALCVDAVCKRAPRVGAPCTSDGRCATGLVCLEDRCRELPPPGDPCTPDRRCGEGAFCPAGESVCAALRAPGQACTNDSECETSICLDTLTCGAEAASCLTTKGAFAQLVGLSLVLPLLSLARRRRRR